MNTEVHPLARRQPDLPAAVLLEDRALFRVSGPGTNDFLQGQLSQNLTEVVAGYSPRGSASTPKGRAYLLTRLVRDGDDILLTMPANLAEAVTTQLRKYMMLFRGTSMTRLENGKIFGLLGDAAAEAVAGDSASLPVEENHSVMAADGHLIRVESTAEGLARFELWLPDGASDSVTGSIRALSQATLADWEASEIAAGIPELTPETQEEWVPQMLNLQHLNGLHFKKGCYTGQEVIARMHFLGQLKKSLFRLEGPASGLPAPGSAVMADDKAVGEVVRAVSFDDDTIALLAVLRHADAEKDLYLTDKAQLLQVMPLPYPVPERDAEQPDT